MNEPKKKDVTVYGTDWCGDTKRTLRHLKELGIDFTYINIDEDPKAEAKVIAYHNGKRRVPLVEIGDSSLSVPSRSDLEEKVGT